MSKQCSGVCDSFACRTLYHFAGRNPLLCLAIFIAAVMTASCGLTGQNSNSQIKANNLMLSGSLPSTTTSETYNAVLSVNGGNTPYQFAISSGNLPPGMVLNPKTGSITGTARSSGTFSFHVLVTDAPLGDQGEHDFSITVIPGGGNQIRVNVSPSSATVVSNQTRAFTASVTGTDNKDVAWSASSGTITQQGVYTAPVVNAVSNFFITATSKADSRTQGVAKVVVEPPQSQNGLAITTTGVPDGQTGQTYSAAFNATGGTQPYSWSVSGSLPPGLAFGQNTGQLGGVPTSTGTFNFSVSVKDSKAQTAQKSFSLSVDAASGNFDGPAELPRVTVATSMADSPAPGTVIPVNASANLQAALNSAHCGDTLQLQAGATFSGTFTLPAKNCDDNHWIVIRTSAADSELPQEGQRATPCYAGVGSLTGRPQYVCTNARNVMAKLVRTGMGDGPVVLQSGANHYRLLGLEITRAAGVKGSPTLVSLDEGAADHIIVDRSWLHGTAQDETGNGFSLKGMNYAAAVDSYFNDFHCTSVSGTCTDSHAVGGGNGNHQDGPFKIEGNFLEAAGEAVMFGGGAATVTPTDIEVRRNHFFKPWQWMQGNAKFVGGPKGDAFIVKNHLELKNAVRVLIEANLMENVWGGFSQTGHAILLTPKNQHTRDGNNVCPICQVTDVTVRLVHIDHAGGGMAMGTIISGDGTNGAPAYAGTRWSIHDVVLDDINHNYVGGGSLFEFQNGWPANPLNTITVNHVTGFPDPTSHLMTMGNVAANPKMYGLVFTNNLVSTGRYPVWNTGGGETSCAYSGTPAEKINNCFVPNSFSNNALIATPDAFPPSSWPSGNFFPDNPNDVRFAQYDGGLEGDYALQPNSPYKNAGTDGKDLGADIAALENALSGVE